MSSVVRSSTRLRGVSPELAPITGSSELEGYSVFTTKDGGFLGFHPDNGGRNHVPGSLPVSSLIVDSASSGSLPSYDSLSGGGDFNGPSQIEQSVRLGNGSNSRVLWMFERAYDPSMYQSGIVHRKQKPGIGHQKRKLGIGHRKRKPETGHWKLRTGH